MKPALQHALALLLLGLLTAVGCASTHPKVAAGTIARTSPESFYTEAPWTRVRPRNIKAMGDAAVATTQGLADISATYQQQLQFQQQAQMARLNSSPPYQSRAAEITECLGAGGGRQGGMQCERMGFEAYDAEYGVDAMNRKALEAGEVLSDTRILGWGQYDASRDFENWKAGHDFGVLILNNMRMWEARGDAMRGR
jgi:hypothetical protein